MIQLGYKTSGIECLEDEDKTLLSSPEQSPEQSPVTSPEIKFGKQESDTFDLEEKIIPIKHQSNTGKAERIDKNQFLDGEYNIPHSKNSVFKKTLNKKFNTSKNFNKYIFNRSLSLKKDKEVPNVIDKSENILNRRKSTILNVLERSKLTIDEEIKEYEK